jgi:hypothetical protein
MSYNVAEMYLGVIVVAVLLCLLPTLAVFYFYVFMSIILTVMVGQLGLIFLQIFFTDFPYFLIIFAIRQPYILPGGI